VQRAPETSVVVHVKLRIEAASGAVKELVVLVNGGAHSLNLYLRSTMCSRRSWA